MRTVVSRGCFWLLLLWSCIQQTSAECGTEATALLFSTSPKGLVYKICSLHPETTWEATTGVEFGVLFNDVDRIVSVYDWNSLTTDNCCREITVNPGRLPPGRGNLVLFICPGLGATDTTGHCSDSILLSSEEVLVDMQSIVHVQPQSLMEEPGEAVSCNGSTLRGLPHQEPLSRQSICDEIAGLRVEVKAEEWLAEQEATTDKERRETEDTLVIFAFSHSENGWREDNLFFFLAFGLPQGSRYHTVVVVNGDLDTSWYYLFQYLQDTRSGFSWVQRDNVGRDVCAWKSVMDNQPGQRQFRRFIFLNASVRGPFLPSYFKDPWPEAFFGLLTNSTRLAGCSICCGCTHGAMERSSQSGRSYRKHVCADDVDQLSLQSYLVAFDENLSHFISALMQLTCDSPDLSARLAPPLEWEGLASRWAENLETHWATRNPRPSHITKPGPGEDGRPWLFEAMLAPEVLRAGYNIGITQYLWRDVDFTDPLQVKELCYSALTDASVGSHFLSPSAYAGSNVHPMELVFYKTEYGERRVLDALTTMTLQHSRIGIPLAFCFR